MLLSNLKGQTVKINIAINFQVGERNPKMKIRAQLNIFMESHNDYEKRSKA